MDNLHGILLDVGTNEVEIASLRLGGNPYGINCAKLREIIPLAMSDITKIPSKNPGMMGILMHRGDAVPMIDLSALLHLDNQVNRVAMVIEVSMVRCGLVCEAVDRIHRLSWKDLHPLGALSSFGAPVTGTVIIDDEMLPILDIESLVAQVLPAASMDEAAPPVINEHIETQRSDHTIFVADDSGLIRRTVETYLLQAGYKTTTFSTGREAWQAIVDEGKRPSLLITDIEMPEMDGLTLCRRLKERDDTKSLPIVLFSSLLAGNDDDRGDRVGADGVFAKPQLNALVPAVDELLKIELQSVEEESEPGTAVTE
ncbi:MAG: chemotaxis protein [Myxococcales bacterium]|nr:chemotaxis protein [Myxococcales bacterium]